MSGHKCIMLRHNSGFPAFLPAEASAQAGIRRKITLSMGFIT